MPLSIPKTADQRVDLPLASAMMMTVINESQVIYTVMLKHNERLKRFNS